MKINIIFFGQLSEITGTKNISLEDMADTKALNLLLHSTYPLLKDQPYRIAVNNQLVSEDVLFDEDCTVALLPPFSGG